MAKDIVLRKEYLRKLSLFKDKADFVKVITGVRRSGKSTLISQFIDQLKNDGTLDEDIIRISFEDPEYFNIRNDTDLAEILFPQISKDKKCYIFLDEIQRVENWERVVNTLISGTESDVYITGSNAHLLSSELSTYLTGRYVRIDILPLSFAEWKDFRCKDLDPSAALYKYMTYGGFPGVDPSMGDESVKTILRDMYASIVKWDIASRGQIRNMEELDRLMLYLMQNIGNPMSINNIVEGLGAGRELVDRYIELMKDAYVIYRADRYDIKSSALNPSPKYYSVDPGLRDMAIGSLQNDVGRVLENVVYLELIRRGYTIQVGKYGAKEIDFVVSSIMGEKAYYQVCLSMADESTSEREISVLRSIKDNFAKIILTLDPVVKHSTEDGVIIMSVTDWLLEN